MLKRACGGTRDQARRACDTVFADPHREYSAERVFAFHEYSERASLHRVVLVLSLNLGLPLIVLTTLDVIPLQDPRDGWSANVSFWMRTFVNAIFVCGGIMVQARIVIPDVNLTNTKAAMIVVGVCFGYTGSLMLLARLWVFPVPFTFTMGGLPFCVSMLGFAVFMLGTRDRAQLVRFAKFAYNIAIQTSMMFVYPTYNAIFLTLEGPAQLALVLLLPVIKLGFKVLIGKVQSADDDLIPAILSSVDIFDALYMTKCMQSAGTILVGFGIIGIDVVQNVYAMVGLVRQTRTLREVYAREKRDGASSVRSIRPNNKVSNRIGSRARSLSNLGAQLPASTNLFEDLLATFKRLDPSSNVRFASMNRFQVSPQMQEQLRRLREASLRASPQLPRKDSRKKSGKAQVAVAPMETPAADHAAGPTSAWNEASAKEPGAAEHVDTRDTKIFKEAAQLLHECEAVAVIEYIETVVPIFYALYISILFHLPNAQYYQDMRHFTAEKLHTVVINILIYAFMELLSLIWVHRMLKRSFGVSVLHQLAFAMENEWRLFQCNFVSWILVVFQFLLIHNGSDFSFKFRWMHGSEHHSAAIYEMGG